ncbi:peptidase G2 autoproteolytic cleavage domain-containing protein [Fontibacillus sp. BL9]|uniref:peptidase G2 autoproteolytic cleavage domain-containing protein n=1 Tax=Fontibacillus sp. BL9 TaxID=3389971 RepID=UPI00397C6395
MEIFKNIGTPENPVWEKYSPSKGEGEDSHIEGIETTASGMASHSEGYSSNAVGKYSHAEGYKTVAGADSAHTEGFETLAYKYNSHVEGITSSAASVASRIQSISGATVTLVGPASQFKTGENVYLIYDSSGTSLKMKTTVATILGNNTLVLNNVPAVSTTPLYLLSTTVNGAPYDGGNHVEGRLNLSKGQHCHIEGFGNTDDGYTGTHIMGKHGDANSSYSWFLANGTSPTARGLAAKILSTGQMFADGAYSSTGADYAEMFEWLDHNPKREDRVGYFVTLDGDKIRKATLEDDFILGIVSANPSIIGDNNELNWKGRFITDEWGRTKYHLVETPPITVEPYGEGQDITKLVEIIPARVEKHPLINPAWNPDMYYVGREHRPEWSAIGLMGKLLVRDDGSCQVNGYCRSNDGGIATNCEDGFRVMKRISPNIIQVLMR